MSRDLQQHIAQLSPIAGVQVDAMDLKGSDKELAEAIMLTALRESGIASPTPKRRSPWMRRLALPAMALVVAFAILLTSGTDLRNEPSAPAVKPDAGSYSLAALRVAESAPRYLISLPGWKVTAADQFSAEYGSTRFSNGGKELEINWYLASEYQDRLEGKQNGNPGAGTFKVEGAQGQVFRYEMPTGGDFDGIWLKGDHTVIARGQFADFADYLEVVESLKITDVETWLAAMPENVVRAESRAEAVDEILADIPIPPGLDVEALRAGPGVLERYHLGAEVVSEVSCGWINMWRQARNAGDAATAQRATEAMATSREWKILQEMKKEGAYPQVIWQLVDAMPKNGQSQAGSPTALSEVDLESSLGCGRVGPEQVAPFAFSPLGEA